MDSYRDRFGDLLVYAKLSKPCPLCGSRDIVTESKHEFLRHKRDYGPEISMTITCVGCGVMVRGVPESGCNEAYRSVLKRWNRRAA